MKHAVRIFLFQIMLLISHSVIPQEITPADSIKRILLRNDLSLGEKVSLYEGLSVYYCTNDIEQTFKYSRIGLELAIEAEDYIKEASFYRLIGGAYDVKGNLDSAIYYYDKTYEMALQHNDPHMEGQVYGMRAFSYLRHGKYIQALQSCMKVMEHFQGSENTLPMILSLGYIGEIYQILGNSERALGYVQQALGMAEKINHLYYMMHLYNRMGAVYTDKKDYQKALEYLELGFQTSNIGNNQLSMCVSLRGKARVYLECLDYEKALQYAEQAVSVARKVGDPTILVGALNVLSDIYREQERYSECEAAACEAWQTDSTYIEFAPNLAYNIALSNSYLLNREKSLYYLKKSGELNQGKIGKNIHQTLLDLEVKNESEKNELRIVVLEKEKKLNKQLNVASVAILCLLSGLFFFSFRVISQKKKIAEQQIAHLKQEKRLVTAQALLEGETTERRRIARDLHDGLGGMLSVVKLKLKELENLCRENEVISGQFSQSFSLLDNVIKELRSIAHHMMPVTLGHSGLKTSIEDFCKAIPGARFYYMGDNIRLETHLEILIYRCAYELVNNALKHAEASVINVQLIADKKFVSLTVQDNGVGFDPETVTSGTGLENVKTRVAAYDGVFRLYSTPGTGTEVCIEIEINGS